MSYDDFRREILLEMNLSVIERSNKIVKVWKDNGKCVDERDFDRKN